MTAAIRWITAFLDRPADTFEAATAFWRTVTGTTMSPSRGEHAEFATLVPDAGDAYLRVQRTADGSGGTHIDLHTDDVAGLVDAAMSLGATRARGEFVVDTLVSPGGMTFCCVGHHGEHVRPTWFTDEAGTRSIVDQVSIDIPAGRYETECEFWSDLTGSELHPSSVRSEFTFVTRGADQALRLMLQRRDDDAGAATAHLDWSCDDVAHAARAHVELGATLDEEFRYWTVVRDPSGEPYCLTARSPDWGFTDPTG